MAGANLLQRQLLPQARAAQKQMGAPAGINHLLARPMPRAVPGHRQGGAAASAMGGASAALASGAVGASQSQRGMSTGAYGFAEDYGGGSGMASAAAGGAAGTGTGGGGSKRSYGSQLLQLQRQVAAAMEGARWDGRVTPLLHGSQVAPVRNWCCLSVGYVGWGLYVMLLMLLRYCCFGRRRGDAVRPGRQAPACRRRRRHARVRRVGPRTRGIDARHRGQGDGE